MLTMNELFSGIGTQALALKYLGADYKVVGTSEIEKNAIGVYNTLHGETRNYGDISKIDKLDYADLWTYSFPCFTGDTLVLTDKGYKKMENVAIGDITLTHNCRLRPIVNKFDNGKHQIWEVKTSNTDVIRTTEHHKFYVVTRSKKWNKDLNKYDYIFSDPYWKECCQLTKSDYILSPTYTETKVLSLKNYPELKDILDNNFIKNKLNQKDFYWILGRYVGDGWNGYDNSGIIICCSKNNDEYLEIEEKLNKLNMHFNKVEERTIFKYHIISTDLAHFCLKFNKGAINRSVPYFIFNLPIDDLISFVNGYLSADGCKVNNTYKITSISRELLYGVGLCVTKCYNVPFRLYKNIMPKTTIIEGRVVNQHDFYQLVFDLRTDIKRTSSVYINNNYWYVVQNVKNTEKIEQVYDIEVEEDHSFVVQGLIVKNCQDLSSGGKGKGVAAIDENGNKVVTRSGLLWEVERLLAKSCGYDIVNGLLVENKNYKKDPPKYLLLENVPELIDVKKHRIYFEKWLERLEELGYINSYGKLNGNDFGVPQNRERVFCLSVRKDIYGFKVDLPFVGSNIEMPKKGKIEDFVEKEVMEYQGSLKIDEKISNYLLPAYTRDIEQIAECKNNPLNNKDIWTCKCKSGFQDHRVGITCSPTIRHQNSHTAVFVNNQIHKLTGRECWHFMGIKDEDYQKVVDNLSISDNIMCGLAGNAIVVPVLMSIFNQILRIDSGKDPYFSPFVPFLTMNDKVRLED